MHSIKELKIICRKKDKPAAWQLDHWGERINRACSVYLTWILLNTPLSPNQITMIGTILTIGGFSLFLINNFTVHIIALFVIFFSFLWDASDGEIARYRRAKGLLSAEKTGDLGAVYVEPVSHDIQYAFMFLPIGLGVFLASGNAWPLIAAFVATSGKLLFRLAECRFDAFKRSLAEARGESVGWVQQGAAQPATLAYFLYMHIFIGSMTFYFLIIAVILHRLDYFLYFYAGGFTALWLYKMWRQRRKIGKLLSDYTGEEQQNFLSNSKAEQLEYVVCPVCKRDDALVVSRKANLNKDWTNVICKNCALVYVNPRPTKITYDEFHKYDFLAGKNVTKIEHVLPKLKARDRSIKESIANFLSDYLKDGQTVLDIGCGYGTLLDILRNKKRISVYGVELGELDIEVAEKYYGLKIFRGSLDAFAADLNNHGKFDLVIMNHVLEHLPDPLEALRQVKKILSPEGLLYIGLPNILNMKNRPEVFFHIAHATNFSPHSLKLLLHSAGFGIIKFNLEAALPGGMELVAGPGAAAIDELILNLGRDYREVIAHIEKARKKFRFLRGARTAVLFFLPEHMRIKAGRLVFLFLKNGWRMFGRS